MNRLVPPPLRAGDLIRVIAPSMSKAVVDEHDHSARIEQRLRALGLRLSYAEHIDERDAFSSAAIEHRLADLHAAFTDTAVAGILTVIDWELIAAHPKTFCGYSDITALQAAMLARAGLVTFSGPHWSSFGMRDHFEATLESFRRTLFEREPVAVGAADVFSDDPWFLDQDLRVRSESDGWWRLSEGEASGTIVGGNLCTLNLLQGTPYMPSLAGAVLIVEDDAGSDVQDVARNLTSLLQLPDASELRGLVIGRFQHETQMTRALMAEICARQPALAGVPVLANCDVGHTFPMATVPIGGHAEMSARRAVPRLVVAVSKK